MRFSLVLVLVTAAVAHAQLTSTDIRRDLSHVDELMGQGKYSEGATILKADIDRFQKARQGVATGPFFAYLAAIGLEYAQYPDVEKLLKTAESNSTKAADEFDGVVARTQAEAYLAHGDYEAALKAANRAWDRFGSNGAALGYLRAYYCQSLAAEAQLGLGKLPEAEKLIREAIKLVPKGNDEPTFFAPRILFAACRIEIRRDNLTEAEEFCQHGAAMAENVGANGRNAALGQLTLAQLYFQKGTLLRARAAANKAMDLTEATFGTGHPDAMRALQILARIDAKEKKTEEAEVRARTAVEIAIKLYGLNSPFVEEARKTLAEVTQPK